VVLRLLSFNSLSRDHGKPGVGKTVGVSLPFNSLSRDHRPAPSAPSPLPSLSTPSLGITRETRLLHHRPYRTFNSLSRDHFREEQAPEVADHKVAFNSLSRDHRISFGT